MNQNLIEKLQKLSVDMDQYASDHDPYDYADTVGTHEAGISQIFTELMAGRTRHVREILTEDIRENRGDGLKRSAAALLKRLDQLQKDPAYQTLVQDESKVYLKCTC